MEVFKELFFPRSFSGRVKALLTGTPKTLFAKSYIKSSPNVRKRWVKSEFSIKNFFLNLIFCSHGIQFWKNCRNLLTKSLTKFFLKIRELKQKIDFSKESRQKRSSGHACCGSHLYQKSFNQIEKKSIVHFLVFFQNVPLDTEEAGVTIWTNVFCSEPKLGENLKTVSFNLLFPQNVPLEMIIADLTTLPISFEVAKEFHIMCGNDKKTLIFPTRFNFSALLHWTRKGSLTILPKVFRPNSETSHFCKSLRKIVFLKKFLCTSKSQFWQACRNLFCQKLH